ncbi:MAG: hypothetical protein A2W90_11440 [Bacteroidetes bacterium GWF2_42_66]|nr:MAG: hypothetical protein A2W92_13445 [Bacteroidetes bacterium GWA2_42_15]OFY01811.1 MAG: hypothetical protein A2W89_23130 [Bacteroidetes bacterium GWE2_42_39]OFY44895.1 MAG: hypothetical protein A2W90_11440 [Bacteroidetes bacterium GWF2_42_66]HBL76022.1 hypothetical protein [Prolixibacteraceae bacterium]HCR89648.1 hypothetical protein [Prolixibacteraceae bacterium]
MKQIALLILLTAITFGCLAQPKFEFGLSTEGSWVMKKELTIGHNYQSKNNWGTGLGFYVSAPIWWHFSISGGAKYRYAELQQGAPDIQSRETDQGTDLYFVYDWRRFHRQYLVFPLNLNLLFPRDYFITGGIEYCRILNDYTSILKNPEYNWTIGIGSQKHKLRWSLQYLRGFNEQRIQNKASVDGSDPAFLFYYQTNRLQLNLSYPLWKK